MEEGWTIEDLAYFLQKLGLTANVIYPLASLTQEEIEEAFRQVEEECDERYGKKEN